MTGALSLSVLPDGALSYEPGLSRATCILTSAVDLLGPVETMRKAERATLAKRCASLDIEGKRSLETHFLMVRRKAPWSFRSCSVQQYRCRILNPQPYVYTVPASLDGYSSRIPLIADFTARLLMANTWQPFELNYWHF